MQLRVARLCLDCEELHVGDTCPVCASDRYAFLSAWLPVEERRRWRRPVAKPVAGARRPLAALTRVISSWLGHAQPEPTPTGPRTRASDHVPRFDFDEPGKGTEKPPALDERQVEGDVR